MSHTSLTKTALGSAEVILQVTQSKGLIVADSSSSTSNFDVSPAAACVTQVSELSLIQAMKAAMLAFRTGNTSLVSSNSSGADATAFFTSSSGPALIGQSLEKLTPGQQYSVFVAPAPLGHASLPGGCFVVITATLAHRPSSESLAIDAPEESEVGNQQQSFEIYITPDLSRQVEVLLMQTVESQLEVERYQQLLQDQDEGDGSCASANATPSALSSMSGATTLNRFTEAASADPAFVATIQSLLEAQTASMARQLQSQQKEMEELRAVLRSGAAAKESNSGPQTPSATGAGTAGGGGGHGQYHFSYGSPVIVNSSSALKDGQGGSANNLASPMSTSEAWVEV